MNKKYIFIKLICCIFSLVFFTSSALATEEAELEIKQINKNLYQHTSYMMVSGYGLVGANGLVVIEQGKASIIDTPWTNADTAKLVKWIEDKGLTLDSSLSTHSHADRAGGIAYLNQQGIKTYASSQTNKLLKQAGKETAQYSMKQSPFNLLDKRIQVFYPGAGHTTDNVVVWLAESKTLFGGCLVKSLQSKTLGNVADASVGDWPATIDNIIKHYPAIDRVIPGHGESGDISLLEHTKQLAVQANN